MSTTRDIDDQTPPALERAYRTVTPAYRGRGDGEMTVFGLGYALVLAVLLVPLIPFVVLLWAVSKAFDAVSGRPAR